MQVARIVLQLGIHGSDDDLGFEAHRRKLRNHVLRQGAGTNGAAHWRLILGKRPAIAAISSSVGYVREAPLVFASAAIEATRKAPLLIFDMGHDQYGGRYRKTLTTTVAAMRQIGAKRVFLALSFWRWKNSASKASWALDNEKGAPYHRHEVTDKHSGRVDYLDLFTV